MTVNTFLRLVKAHAALSSEERQRRVLRILRKYRKKRTAPSGN